MAQNTTLLGILIAGTLALVATMVCTVYFALRNEWVYQQRTALNNRFYTARVARMNAGDRTVVNEPWWDAYYMTYGQMMLRFWCWNIHRMRLPSAPQTVGE